MFKFVQKAEFRQKFKFLTKFTAKKKGKTMLKKILVVSLPIFHRLRG